MKYLVCLLLLFAACHHKDKAPSIIGTWEYDRMEMYSGEKMNMQDSLIASLHEQQKGLTFSFSTSNRFNVTHTKARNPEDFLAEQPYELAADKKNLILKNSGRPDDNFAIIDLSDSLLKINVFYSKEAYMVFRKKE